MSIDDLRKKYPVFSYDSFEIKQEHNSVDLYFKYSINDEQSFEHVVCFKGLSEQIDIKILEPFAFHIGLAEMFSYWKLTASSKIHVKAGMLSKDQIEWWKSLLMEGMGEYFYKNQIDFTQPDFVTIVADGKEYSVTKLPKTENSDVLVPLGGGKDSIVTLELFLRENVSVKPLIVYPTTPSSMKIVEQSHLDDTITVDRVIDPELIKLSKSDDYLNGHVPYSASLAFIFLFASTVQKIPYIAVSNERSSDEGNVEYHNKIINHQYSKTLAFETAFQDYINTWLKSDIHFFSFLRPLSELQIGKLFSSMKSYFPIFKSCNRNQQQDSWCGTCPKCVSVALSISPWTGPEKIKEIMGTNPLTDPSNADLIANMTDPKQVKPFECIVDTSEAQICLEFINKGQTASVVSFLKEWGNDSNIPSPFLKILKKSYDNS